MVKKHLSAEVMISGRIKITNLPELPQPEEKKEHPQTHECKQWIQPLPMVLDLSTHIAMTSS